MMARGKGLPQPEEQASLHARPAHTTQTHADGFQVSGFQPGLAKTIPRRLQESALRRCQANLHRIGRSGYGTGKDAPVVIGQPSCRPSSTAVDSQQEQHPLSSPLSRSLCQRVGRLTRLLLGDYTPDSLVRRRFG
jgi:hypothetical protein